MKTRKERIAALVDLRCESCGHHIDQNDDAWTDDGSVFHRGCLAGIHSAAADRHLAVVRDIQATPDTPSDKSEGSNV